VTKEIQRRRQDKRRLSSVGRKSVDYGPIHALFRVWEDCGFWVDHIGVTREHAKSGAREQWNYYKDGHSKRGDIDNAVDMADNPFLGITDYGPLQIERGFKDILGDGHKGPMWLMTVVQADYAPVCDVIRVWERKGWFVHHIGVTAFLTKPSRKKLASYGAEFQGGQWRYRRKEVLR
jgi:hypothetical protein